MLCFVSVGDFITAVYNSLLVPLPSYLHFWELILFSKNADIVPLSTNFLGSSLHLDFMSGRSKLPMTNLSTYQYLLPGFLCMALTGHLHQAWTVAYRFFLRNCIKFMEVRSCQPSVYFFSG